MISVVAFGLFEMVNFLPGGTRRNEEGFDEAHRAAPGVQLRGARIHSVGKDAAFVEDGVDGGHQKQDQHGGRHQPEGEAGDQRDQYLRLQAGLRQ